MASYSNIPSKAVITSVGSALDGGISSDLFPVVAGTADAGTTVEIYDGVRLIGTTAVTPNGSWSFTPTADSRSGAHQFTAIAMNNEGNRGASSEVLSVTLRFSFVVPPEITGFSGHDGSSIAAGSATTESHPQISGRGTAGDVIIVSDEERVIGSALVDSAGRWSFTSATDFADGTHEFHAFERNAAGVQSAESNHAIVTIDTSTPARAVIETVIDHFGPSQGPVAPGATTDDTRPMIIGAGKAGNIVTLYDQATKLGSALIDADGVWAIQPAGPLGLSVHGLVAIESTKAGTQGTPSATYSFFVEVQHAVSSEHAGLLHEPMLDNTHDSSQILHVMRDYSPIAAPALKLSYADLLTPAERDIVDSNKQVFATEKSGSQPAGLIQAEWQQSSDQYLSGAVGGHHAILDAHASANLTIPTLTTVETLVH